MGIVIFLMITTSVMWLSHNNLRTHLPSSILEAEGRASIQSVLNRIKTLLIKRTVPCPDATNIIFSSFRNLALGAPGMGTILPNPGTVTITFSRDTLTTLPQGGWVTQNASISQLNALTESSLTCILSNTEAMNIERLQVVITPVGIPDIQNLSRSVRVAAQLTPRAVSGSFIPPISITKNYTLKIPVISDFNIITTNPLPCKTTNYISDGLPNSADNCRAFDFKTGSGTMHFLGSIINWDNSIDKPVEISQAITNQGREILKYTDKDRLFFENIFYMRGPSMHYYSMNDASNPETFSKIFRKGIEYNVLNYQTGANPQFYPNLHFGRPGSNFDLEWTMPLNYFPGKQLISNNPAEEWLPLPDIVNTVGNNSFNSNTKECIDSSGLTSDGVYCHGNFQSPYPEYLGSDSSPDTWFQSSGSSTAMIPDDPSSHSNNDGMGITDLNQTCRGFDTIGNVTNNKGSVFVYNNPYGNITIKLKYSDNPSSRQNVFCGMINARRIFIETSNSSSSHMNADYSMIGTFIARQIVYLNSSAGDSLFFVNPKDGVTLPPDSAQTLAQYEQNQQGVTSSKPQSINGIYEKFYKYSNSYTHNYFIPLMSSNISLSSTDAKRKYFPLGPTSFMTNKAGASPPYSFIDDTKLQTSLNYKCMFINDPVLCDTQSSGITSMHDEVAWIIEDIF